MIGDVSDAVIEWGNAETSLAGAGKPISLGFFDHRLRSPNTGCYAVVQTDLDDGGLDAEGTTNRWRLSVGVYSVTDYDAAERGALALAGRLRALSATRPVMSSAQLLMAAAVVVNRDGSPTDDEPVFTVLADLYTA